MGDHRASIKIRFEFHGVVKECDMWINYCADELGVDNRVIQLFREGYEEGMEKYDQIVFRSQRVQREQETRRQEQEELKRLKEKYEK